MLNPERLLGALIRQGLGSNRARSRRSRRPAGLLGGLVPGGLKGAVGLGMIGVAVAAFDHFMEKNRTVSTPAGATAPPGFAGQGRSAPPPPPPSPDPRAMLLVRAMVLAAAADGEVDADERAAILSRLQEVGLSSEDRAFVAHELDTPASPESLFRQVDSPELARQVYAVSLLAIDVDHPAESAYLEFLRRRLGLDEETVASIQEELLK